MRRALAIAAGLMMIAIAVYLAYRKAQLAFQNANVLWVATGMGRGEPHPPPTDTQDVFERAEQALGREL
jgi:hypothetical protein